jgi:molybdate transport repressor ModE-like protein
MTIQPRLKLWFVGEDGEYVFGLGMMRLLVEIDRLGSVYAAARELGISYRYALERISKVEKRLNRSLVERTRSGEHRAGGAKLTPLGHKLLDDYRSLEDSFRQLKKLHLDLTDNIRTT